MKSYIHQQQQQQAQPSQAQHHHHHQLYQTANENAYQTPMPNIPSQPYSYPVQYTNMSQSFFNQQQQTNPNYFYVNQLNTSSHPTHQQIQSYTYHTIYPSNSNDAASANQSHLSVYNLAGANIKSNKPAMESSTPTFTSSSSNNESIADVSNIPKYTKPKINQKLSDERVAFMPPPPPRLPPPPPASASSMPSGFLPAPYQPPPPPTYEFVTR